MSEEKKPAETVEAAKPAEAPKAEATAPAETPKADTPKEKKPMDPKKKKKIIIWSCVGGGVVIAAIVAIVLVIVLTKVDYKESYDIVKKLTDKNSEYSINKFYNNYDDCEEVTYYADEDWITSKTYGDYVEGCKKAISPELTDLINQLGNTSGVARDNDVKAFYDKFYNEYQKAYDVTDSEIVKKLEVYDSWHKFLPDSESYDIYYYSDEEKVNTVADYAINSSNDTLKAFGEQWKEKASALFKARKDYKAGTIKYTEYDDKEEEFDDWYKENLPKLSEVLPLKFEGNEYDINDAWSDLVIAISTKYGEKITEDIINGNSSIEDIVNDDSSIEELLKLLK